MAKRPQDKKKLSAKAIKLKALKDQKARAMQAEADIMGAIAGTLVQLDQRVTRLERVVPQKGERGERGEKGAGFWG